jgi:hypothetical protein
MPRVRMTMSCPMARMAMTAVWESTFPRFWVVAKTGDRFDMTRTRIPRISTGPSRSSISRAPRTRSLSSPALSWSGSGTVTSSADGDDVGLLDDGVSASWLRPLTRWWSIASMSGMERLLVQWPRL